MINVYNSLRDDNDMVIKGRTLLYIRDDDIGDEGEIVTFSAGPAITTECAGRLFIVDDWLIDQLDKVRLYYGKLAVKDDEELEPPIKSDLDLEEEEAMRLLEDIRRRRAEKEREKEESERIPVTPDNLIATTTDKEIKLEWQSTDNS